MQPKGPFVSAYFLAYAKQLMQINKLLLVSHMLVKAVYEKPTYEDTIFVNGRL